MILYQADVTEFLQEFKVFSHPVCVLMLYEDIHTWEWSHSDSQTPGKSYPGHLASFRADELCHATLWEHLTPFSDLDSAGFPLLRAAAYHDTVVTCHSVTVVHLWLLRKHPCHTSWKYVVQGWMVLIDSDGSERLKLAGDRLRSRSGHFVDGNIQNKVAHRIGLWTTFARTTLGLLQISQSSPLTGGTCLWGGDHSMAASSSSNPNIGAARDIILVNWIVFFYKFV